MDKQNETTEHPAAILLKGTFDAIREGGRRFVSEAEKQAALEEYVNRLDRAIAALVDVSNDKDAIVEAIQTHWDVSREEAKNRVFFEIRFNSPCRRLAHFLEDEKNYSPTEAEIYLKEKRVRTLLRQEPKLSTMKPKDLFRELENR